MNPSRIVAINRFNKKTMRFPAVLLVLVFTLGSCGGGGGGGSSNSPPSVTTLNATLVTPGGAALNGIVNPNGFNTDAWFEWGTDPALASPNTTSPQALDNVTSALPVNTALAGLSYGTIYYFRAVASNIEGIRKGAINTFQTPNPPPSATTSGADLIFVDSARLNGTVNPNGLSTDVWFEWGTAPNLAGSDNTVVQAMGNGTTPQAASALLTNLTPGTTYYFRVAGSNSAGTAHGAILPFTTLAPPTVSTLGATSITASTALLNGSVNPNGVATDVWFEWGTAPNLAGSDNTVVQAMGNGTTPQAVSASLTNLTPGTTYYFRVNAGSAAGNSTGSIVSFLTALLPSVDTQNASSIVLSNNDTQARATFHGTVNPNGVSTEAWFEWGTDPALGSFTATPHQSAGAGTTVLPISFTATALTPWRMYYFRAVASNNTGGTAQGVIRSFPTGEYYVAVGDSITFGSQDNIPSDDTSLDGRNSGGGYEPILNNLLTISKGYPHTVMNEGVSGDTSADGVNRIAAILSSHPSADVVLVMYGTNDASFPAPLPSGRGLNPGNPGYSGSYKANMQAIISAILAAGKTPCMAKVPFTSDPLRSIASIQEYNIAIDELLFDNGIAVIPPDFYAHFQFNPAELADGVHPNGTGYQSMASIWFTALTQ